MVYDVTRIDAASRLAASSSAAAGASSNSSAAGSSSNSSSGSNAGTISMSTFLQLIVAQIKNQNPLNPADGAEFVAQLAQLQQLQQSVYTGQDIAQIRTDLDSVLGNSDGTLPTAY
jgi:flagellar basal-body rod modification protein FlgD